MDTNRRRLASEVDSAGADTMRAGVTAGAYSALKRVAYALGEPVLRRASRAYVPGPKMRDAQRWAREQAPPGARLTFGYFNAPEEAPFAVEEASCLAIQALADSGHRFSPWPTGTPPGQETWPKGPAGPPPDEAGYCSLKVPALGYQTEALQRLALVAAAVGQRLHFDSHGPETAKPTLAALEALLPQHPHLGLTLPGRWIRSLGDADWAVALGLRVRVVKGQWACPERPQMDPRVGFLAVVDRLAGRVSQVAVATHDADLAAEAQTRLAAQGTTCELELLCGLPRRRVMALAHSRGLPVRFYVPFGQAWLPYAMHQILRQPRLWPRLLKDSLGEAWAPSRLSLERFGKNPPS